VKSRMSWSARERRDRQETIDRSSEFELPSWYWFHTPEIAVRLVQFFVVYFQVGALTGCALHTLTRRSRSFR
jgi:hypothetical protein